MLIPLRGLVLPCSLDETGEVERVNPRVHYNSKTRTLRILIMPTEVHDCHQQWLKNEMFHMTSSGFLTAGEFDYLCVSTGTTFNQFQPPYSSSHKQPGLAIRPDTLHLPTIVVESGWSESWPNLREDMHLWLEGGAPTVQLVMLLKWSKISTNRVRGVIEIYTRDASGAPTLLQAEPIFPSVETSTGITITREQLFGSAVFAGRNASDTFQLSMANLRQVATLFMQSMGSTPA